MLARDFEVVEYDQSPDSLAQLEADRPDLLLVALPAEPAAAIDWLPSIRTHDRLRRIPAIALTPHATVSDRRRCLEAGFEGYITVSLEPERVLRSSITSLLQSSLSHSSPR